MNKCEIYNNSDMKMDDEIHSLVDFTKERLGFKRPPTIYLDSDDQNAQKTLAMTGYYDPESMEIHVYTTGRHPKDILRSIAHELVHHNQNENGDFNQSGYSGKGYAQKNPHLRKMELQANDPMLFRDWEDSLKEKHPTIYNEGRTNIMSLKDWKNKELSKNLTKKWGFKMDLTKLNEAGAAPGRDGRSGPSSYEEEMMQMMQARDAAKKKKEKTQKDESHCGTHEAEEELMEELDPTKYYLMDGGAVYEGPFDSYEEAEAADDVGGLQIKSPKPQFSPEEIAAAKARAAKFGLEEELDENLEEKEMSKKEKEFAALAEPKDKITYADKIAGAKK